MSPRPSTAVSARCRSPPDLRGALDDAGVLATWEGMPPGKREHILAWVEKAVQETTRAKRIARSVEEALKVHERKVDRGG